MLAASVATSWTNRRWIFVADSACGPGQDLGGELRQRAHSAQRLQSSSLRHLAAPSMQTGRRGSPGCLPFPVSWLRCCCDAYGWLQTQRTTASARRLRISSSMRTCLWISIATFSSRFFFSSLGRCDSSVRWFALLRSGPTGLFAPPNPGHASPLRPPAGGLPPVPIGRCCGLRLRPRIKALDHFPHGAVSSCTCSLVCNFASTISAAPSQLKSPIFSTRS